MKRLLSFALLGALISSFLGTPALAGTTGTMRVVVTDANTHAPIAGVQVSAVSPSQSASGVTDAGGGTTFISLAPDSYTVSVLKNGYDPQSQAGISIFADQGQNIAFALHPKLKEIGSVRSVASSSLVRAGTTSDVYSINPSQQRAAKALGGSGSLDQAYSAIASVPGVQIPSGQQGWYQSVFVRGGDYDQVAYEFDGIPVLRESDGAPIVTLSALGQQEVQVYTGGTPATSNSPGLAGYINQVVKTGIYPGYGSFDLAGGAPAFYHKASAEAGGATPNRMISYYVGFAGANQDYRYGSQFNAVSDPLYYYPLWIPGSNANSAGVNLLDGSCGDPTLTTPCPGPNYGAVFSPGNSWTQMNNNDRETVANVHVGIPHRHDTGRDDIQLLYVTGNIFTTYNSSANFLMGSNPTFIGTMNGLTPFTNPFNWLDASVAAGGGIYNGPLNAPPNPNLLVNGPFPSSPTLRALNSPINPNQNDGGSNGYSIEKAQWQRNFNDHSYLRLIGYGEYTNWFLNGPNSSTPTYGATLSDYEVEGWIYGGTVSYSNALSSKNLLTASASYMTQRLQTYNATFTQGSNSGQFGSVIANLTDGQGHCFNFTTGAPWTCYDATQWGTPAAGLTPAL
ncbi:MAG: carboxypeptidase regulatory-like domain-containing protein, partial [Candidatus Eremiobacteraeota bacterium]|nr:carboxypeptidase regulatory-like domain-containing protein [Candidatus Eremiobacteraeota bacterium]